MQLECHLHHRVGTAPNVQTVPARAAMLCTPDGNRMATLILVVDDDDTIRTVIREALQLEGYQVAEARHSQEALDLPTAVVAA
jgi:PleD family two-component response regulator